LMFLRLVLFLVKLVEVLAVIHNPANRRLRCRRYLHQVQAPLLSDFQRLLRCQNSELFVLVVDDTNFLCPNSMVDPYVFVDGLCPPETIPDGTNAKDNMKCDRNWRNESKRVRGPEARVQPRGVCLCLTVSLNIIRKAGRRLY